MPINKKAGEDKQAFISRCMSREAGKFPETDQRYAVCINYWKDSEADLMDGSKCDNVTPMRFIDQAAIGATNRTNEGYLTARVKAARTGVQAYRASELGDVAIAAGFKPNDIVRVNRPEAQVFSKDAMRSLIHAPVTIDHPNVMVDASNWKEFAVGETSDDIMRDGQSLVLSLIVKDADGVNKTQTTHKELSLGYYAEIVDAADKSIADFDMVNFRFNHIAAVPKGRAGPEYRIGDSAANWGASPQTVKDTEMTELKTVILGDKAVKVEASDAETVAAILKDHKAALDTKDAAIGELKAKLADAEAKVLDAEGLAKLVDAAVAAKTQRDAVKAKFGDEAVKDASDAEIAGMYRVIGKVVHDGVRDAIKDKTMKVDDAWGDVIASLPTYGKKGDK